MTISKVMNFGALTGLRRFAPRREVMLGLLASSALVAFASSSLADKLACARSAMKEAANTPPANKKIGVSVAYLKVPF